MFTDSLTVLSHVEVFLCASLSLWFRLLPLLLIQVLSALTHFLPLFLYYFLGNGLKQNTQNSYPGLYIWSAWANVSTSSYISINLLPLFISSFFKWYFCHFFLFVFRQPWHHFMLLSRYQSRRMGHVFALQESGLFIFFFSVTVLLPLSWVFWCLCLS